MRQLRDESSQKRRSMASNPKADELGPGGIDEWRTRMQREEELTTNRLKVFEKVWLSAEKVINRTRIRLFETLEEAWRPMEVQEKHISYLVELDAERDPVWFYLDKLHVWINDMMDDVYSSFTKRLAELKDAMPQVAIGAAAAIARCPRVKKSVVMNDPKEFMRQFGREMDVQLWEAVHATVKALSEIMYKRLPGFWRVSQAYIEDRFYRRNDQTLSKQQKEEAQRRMDVCLRMLRQTVTSYSDMMSAIFGLADRKATTNALRKPDFPTWSGSLTTAYFLGRMVGRLLDCRKELERTDLPAEVERDLAWLERESRKHSVAALCERWLEDSRVFYAHEDWQPDQENPRVTGYTKLFQRFQRQLLAAVGRLLGDAPTGKHSTDSRSKNALERAQHSFAWTTMAWLDTLHHLATRPQPDQDRMAEQVIQQRKIEMVLADFKLLNVLRNLAHLRDEILPGMAEHATSSLVTDVSLQLSTLRATVNRLQKRLLTEYVSRKLPPITSSIRQGILESGVDWINSPIPKEIRTYLHRTLLILVLVHGEVTSAAPAMTTEVLGHIQDRVSQTWIDSIRRLDKVGIGMLLQMKLESRFLKHSLRGHQTDMSDAHYQMVEEILDEICSSSDMSPEERKQWLDDRLDMFIGASRAQLLCFGAEPSTIKYRDFEDYSEQDEKKRSDKKKLNVTKSSGTASRGNPTSASGSRWRRI